MAAFETNKKSAAEDQTIGKGYSYPILQSLASYGAWQSRSKTGSACSIKSRIVTYSIVGYLIMRFRRVSLSRVLLRLKVRKYAGLSTPSNLHF